MGIAGLLPLLKKASKHSHLRNFSGSTAVIDAFSWLHKGAFGCAVKLGKGEPTLSYVHYCIKYINVLIAHGVKPILVFDGTSLPAKELTNERRRKVRKENREIARELVRKGNNRDAYGHFIKAIEITTEMTRELIKELRARKIDYVIAPYEADAQMAYMVCNGIADLVITEDSDLVLFGCPKIFFKLSLNGDGVYFESSKLPKCLGILPEKFHFEKFRQMCILSGCDYLDSIPGIGLKRAQKLLTHSSEPDLKNLLTSIPKILNMDVEVTQEYIDGFTKAELTFKYQLAFDLKTRELVPLTPYESFIKPLDVEYAGRYCDKKKALDLALGNIDCKSFERVDNWYPDDKKNGYTNTSIWCKNFQLKPNASTFEPKKNQVKGSSTLGIQMSVNFKLNKKRHLQNEDDPKVEIDHDDDIVSLYKSPCKENDEELISETKRVMMDYDLLNDDKDLLVKTEKSSNPFLKPEKDLIKTTSVLPNGSVCTTVMAKSIFKREVRIQLSPLKKSLLVKSQYFRSESQERKVKSGKINLVDEKDLKTCDIEVEEIPVPEFNSQRSIYSNISIDKEDFHLDSQCSLGNSEKNSSQGIDASVELDDSDEDVQFLHENKKMKVEKRSPHFNSKKNTIGKGKKGAACRRQGLRKRPPQIDHKQRSIRDMFGAK